MLGRSSFVATAALLSSALCASPIHAASPRVFVSGLGSDTPACGARTSPCRTFQQAHGLVPSGGEIVTIDSADYGKLDITKAISVINEGAGVAATGGLTINAGWSDAILLRGLLIENLGSTADGVRFRSGAGVTISNCIVRKFASFGIAITPSSAAPSAVAVDIRDTLVEKNGDTGVIFGGAAVKATIDGVTANANYSGVAATPDRASTFTIANSSASGNSYAGFHFSARASVMVRDSYAANNEYGFTAAAANGSGATLYLTRSSATGNVYGVFVASGGFVYSYGDNRLGGNKAGKVSGALKSAAGD